MVTNLLIQSGSIFIPFGFAMFAFSPQLLKGHELYIAWALSVLIMAFGFWCFFNALKVAKLEDKQDNDRFNLLIGEIKGLRADINNKQHDIKDRGKKK